MPSPNEITIAQLARLIGTPDSPVLIDLCLDEDFALDPCLIPSAYRHPFMRINDLVEGLRGKRTVVYRQRGRKISQGAAALLRAQGVVCEWLAGGQIAWREAGQALVPAAKIPATSLSAGRGSIWVTRHRPKIDRIACPWLIRRFVDPWAQFLFVSPSAVLDVADKFSATAFDVEGVFWSHRGECCTFDTMIDEFSLQSVDALRKLALIVRGADTDQHNLAAESAGLLAVSLGLSRMYRDDHAQLEAGMHLYDAFYRWARDASSEKHHWPSVPDNKLDAPANGMSGPSAEIQSRVDS